MMFPETAKPLNIEVVDKEYVLQHILHKWRCISWHPHHIMTNWVNKKETAIADGDVAIEKYYRNNEHGRK